MEERVEVDTATGWDVKGDIHLAAVDLDDDDDDDDNDDHDAVIEDEVDDDDDGDDGEDEKEGEDELKSSSTPKLLASFFCKSTTGSLVTRGEGSALPHSPFNCFRLARIFCNSLICSD